MPFDFAALAPVTEPFTDPADGKPYTVVAPASAEAAIAFRQNNMEAHRLKDEGGDREEFARRILEGDAVLVRASVRDADGDRPPLAVVKAWPDDMLRQLYDWVVDRSPNLVGRTPEALAAEIARLTAVRDRLLGGGDPKASPAPSAGPST